MTGRCVSQPYALLHHSITASPMGLRGGEMHTIVVLPEAHPQRPPAAVLLLLLPLRSRRRRLQGLHEALVERGEPHILLLLRRGGR